MTEPKAYRVYWCGCGQKMRVLLPKLGRTGRCVACGRRIKPTLENTVLPGEGPRTPPPKAAPGVPAGSSEAASHVEIDSDLPEAGSEKRSNEEEVASIPASSEPHAVEEQLQRLRRKRKSLFLALGMLAYEQRVLLPPNHAIQSAIDAIETCNNRIGQLEESVPEPKGNSHAPLHTPDPSRST